MLNSGDVNTNFARWNLIYRVALHWSGLALVVLVHDGRRFFPVNPEVLFEVARLAEALPAGLADVGALPGVQALVDNHLVALRERLLTILARVRPRVRVDALVLAQQVAPLKVLGAEGTLVRPLVRVHAPGVQLKL